jgi:hypothetical protein
MVQQLVNRDYDGIERATQGRNVTASELREAVADYGGTLRMPPAAASWIDEVQVVGRVPPTWSVRCDLWTVEEGRSDLSLELTVVEAPLGPTIEVDNLHVL